MGTSSMPVDTQPEWIKDVLMFVAFVGTMFGLQYKASKAHRYRIDRLEAEIANTKKDTADALKKNAEAELRLTECRLGIEKEFASKDYLQAVETRIVAAITDLKTEFRNHRDRSAE